MNEFIDIVVVNWNSGSQLSNCIEFIQKYDAGLVRNIIVVDNGSVDDSESFLEKQANVKLIRTGENLGFGRACNIGAKHGNSEFVLFLNPDAQLFENSLSSLVQFTRQKENEKNGIFGIQLIDEEGHIAQSCTRFPSIAGLIAHATGFDRVFPALGHFMTEWDHASTRRVDHVIGAFFLLRRPLFDLLHGFDERFFVYLEDLDISYRAKSLGWSAVYFAEAQAFHAGGGTSRQVKAKRLFYSLRSSIIYAFKHFNVFAAAIFLLVTLLIEPFMRSILALFRGSWPSLKETWLAYGMLVQWLPRWILKGETR